MHCHIPNLCMFQSFTQLPPASRSHAAATYIDPAQTYYCNCLSGHLLSMRLCRNIFLFYISIWRIYVMISLLCTILHANQIYKNQRGPTLACIDPGFVSSIRWKSGRYFAGKSLPVQRPLRIGEVIV